MKAINIWQFICEISFTIDFRQPEVLMGMIFFHLWNTLEIFQIEKNILIYRTIPNSFPNIWTTDTLLIISDKQYSVEWC